MSTAQTANSVDLSILYLFFISPFFCARVFGTWKNMPTYIKINWFLRSGFIRPKSIITKSISRVLVNWFYINSVKTCTCGQYAQRDANFKNGFNQHRPKHSFEKYSEPLLNQSPKYFGISLNAFHFTLPFNFSWLVSVSRVYRWNFARSKFIWNPFN